MFDINLALMTGADIPIPECQLVLHQPSIKEISFMGESDFFTGLQYLCIKTEYCEGLPAEVTNFVLFLTLLQQAESASKKNAVINVLTLLFPEFNVAFTPQSLLLTNKDGVIAIDDYSFRFLQDILETVFCLKKQQNAEEEYNPTDAKAKEIAEKLKAGRKKIAELKAANNSDSIFSRYLSILTVGLNSMSLKDLIELTPYQLYDLIERYSLYINWDLEIRSRLAGGKSDSEPENWMKSIH